MVVCVAITRVSESEGWKNIACGSSACMKASSMSHSIPSGSSLMQELNMSGSAASVMMIYGLVIVILICMWIISLYTVKMQSYANFAEGTKNKCEKMIRVF